MHKRSCHLAMLLKKRYGGFMKTVLLVFGTRPEAIKMCPVVKAFYQREGVRTVVAVSGQHRGMLDQVLRSFDVVPDYDLDLMREGQSLFDVTSGVLCGMGALFSEIKPDVVLVHGDTTTAFAASLAAYYLKIPVGHIEAGLRTRDIYSPFPEEFNRRAIADIAHWHFAPTLMARDNLLIEGREKGRVFVTGNTVIDALKMTVREDFCHELLDWGYGSRLLLLTAHRRENLGELMRQMLLKIRRTVERYPDVKVICPLHPNPLVQRTARAVFEGCERIRLVDALDCITFHNILSRCYFVLTDSGGIQEEATALGKPVLVMRDTTERPEGVAFGALKLVGKGGETLTRYMRLLLEDTAVYTAMAKASDLYGDGDASRRIVDIILS